MLLYSLVRMTRPRVCIEYGSGYSTFFLLAALRDNNTDIGNEIKALEAKSRVLEESSGWEPTLTDSVYSEWLENGGLACQVDPDFYVKSRTPHLYSFEGLSDQHSYVRTMLELLKGLSLADMFSQINGTRFMADRLPDEAIPIDLAWNDAKEYEEFFAEVWPLLNPNGGLMILHNTISVKRFSDAVDSIRASRRKENDLEMVTLIEPHKLCQNSCTIFRRKPSEKPAFLEDRGSEVKANLQRFMRLDWSLFPDA